VAGCAFLLSYLPALYRTKVTVPATGPLGHLWVRGDRYTVTPILIIISAMIIVADAALNREGSRLFWRRRRLQVASAVAASVLIACIIATWATDYRYIVARSYYAAWSPSVDYAAQGCAKGYHAYLSAVRAWVPCDWLDANHPNGANNSRGIDAQVRFQRPRWNPRSSAWRTRGPCAIDTSFPFRQHPQIGRDHRRLVVVGGLNVTEGLTLDEIEGRWAKAPDILPGFRQHAPSSRPRAIGCDGVVPKIR
jgi:hypothetical protein